MRNLAMDTDSPEATRELGAKLGNGLGTAPTTSPIVIYLSGELGAGKTTFVSGLLRSMGVTGAVRSPTYTLIEPYDLGERTIYHLDLYRLSEARDLEMLALRDLLQPGAALLVEWAERGVGVLPLPDLTLLLRYPEPIDAANLRRTLVVGALTETGEYLLNKLVARVS